MWPDAQHSREVDARRQKQSGNTTGEKSLEDWVGGETQDDGSEDFSMEADALRQQRMVLSRTTVA